VPEKYFFPFRGRRPEVGLFLEESRRSLAVYVRSFSFFLPRELAFLGAPKQGTHFFLSGMVLSVPAREFRSSPLGKGFVSLSHVPTSFFSAVPKCLGVLARKLNFAPFFFTTALRHELAPEATPLHTDFFLLGSSSFLFVCFMFTSVSGVLSSPFFCDVCSFWPFWHLLPS